MNKKQIQELKNLEKQIIKTANYHECYSEPLNDWNEETKKELKELLGKRKKLLNEMFECNQTEVESFRRVNGLLYNLTPRHRPHQTGR